MSIIKVVTITTIVLIAIAVLINTFFPFDPERRVEMTGQSYNIIPDGGSLPQIDIIVPPEIETATFALG